jgi:hypothetical protein
VDPTDKLFGGVMVAGGKLKESGTSHWVEPNTGATNESGFTALPGGVRGDNGEFFSIGYYGTWYSSTEVNTDYSWHRGMSYSSIEITDGYGPGIYGFTVRCLGDFPVFINEDIYRDSIKVYPNPASGTLTINCDLALTKIEIYNNSGEKVWEDEYRNTIDLHCLPPGVYLLKLMNDQDVLKIEKIIIE